jgi:ribosomal protein S18 acetylase RimI-like enzyme
VNGSISEKEEVRYNCDMEDLMLVSHEGELNPEDKKVMVDGMLAYHASQGHPRKVTTSSILLKNKSTRLYGVVSMSFLWNGMEIQSLWVEESVRNQGWGTKLMEAAEQEGRKRGCTFSYTNTFTWQAPEFYEKLGYTLYGKLEDFPEGNSLSYYRKNLG